MASVGSTAARQGKLRIIGGKWRGRKLVFPALPGLRPTTDRIRETLFNWLSPRLANARCADLFAGSGALGLEALSRGAASCDFADLSELAISRIREHLQTLQAVDRGHCHAGPAADLLLHRTLPYDIIFVDPPFGGDLVTTTCEMLIERKLVAAEALIYIETAVDQRDLAVPADWRIHRDKTAGGVLYRLFEAPSAIV